MRARSAVTILVALLVGLLGLALSMGPTGFRSILVAGPVLVELRAPRVLLAALVGASLGLSGVGMQTLLGNELADPYVLGLSGGASAAAVCSLALWPGLPPSFSAAFGAAGAAGLVRALSRGPYDATRLLLAGVAVSAVLASVTGLVLVLAPSDRLLRSATFWLFGGLGTPRWGALVLPSMLLTAVFVWMRARAERLDRLSLGSDVAQSLGVEVASLRRGVLTASVLLTAISVAASGLVGFVGLIAPHAARRWVGPAHRGLLPTATLGGAILVLLADALARTAFAPREVPVGLVTATVGGPFFLWQLQRGAR